MFAVMSNPSLLRGVTLHAYQTTEAVGPGGLIETYISRMWAILLGCILWEAHCNNREREEGKRARARARGGGGLRNGTSEQ